MAVGREGAEMNGLEELARVADRAYYVMATLGLAYVLATWWAWRNWRG